MKARFMAFTVHFIISGEYTLPKPYIIQAAPHNPVVINTLNSMHKHRKQKYNHRSIFKKLDLTD